MRAQKKLSNCIGGTLIEYALIAGIAVMALTLMTTYVSRGVTSLQNKIDSTGGSYQ